jgi:phospholipid/cholesterol/gamma-HCH transport system ATP-binding protein
MLYDEPTTGLDPITTRIVHELMASMQQQLGLTSIVVSHDREIFHYADKVALLHHGKIHYYGDAQQVHTTDNLYIQQFLQGLSEGPLQSELDNHILTL